MDQATAKLMAFDTSGWVVLIIAALAVITFVVVLIRGNKRR